MSTKIHAIPVKKIKRVDYESAYHLAKSIAEAVRTTGSVTISFKHHWWARGIISPRIGDAANLLIGYPKKFKSADLMERLVKKNELFAKNLEKDVVIITKEYYHG